MCCENRWIYDCGRIFWKTVIGDVGERRVVYEDIWIEEDILSVNESEW